MPNRYESSEHIGSIYTDKTNGLVWVTNASSKMTCYDLNSMQAVDYTTNGDYNRIYQSFRQYADGMWMWSGDFGLRHVAYKDGKFFKYDYNVSNHALPSNDIKDITEDRNHAMWVATTKGLVRIGVDNRARTIIGNINILAVKTWRDKVFAFTVGNHILTFSLQGRKLREDVLPASLGHISILRTNIMWQGKWLMFSPNGGYVYNSHDSKFSRPADIQILRATMQQPVPGFQFIADRSGRLWMFPDKGDMKILNLVKNAQFPPEKGHIYFPAIDKRGVIWIGTYCGGLYSYNIHNGVVGRYSMFDKNPLIDDNYVLCTMVDNHGDVWVGTEYGGISCIYKKGNLPGKYIPLNDTPQNVWENTLMSINVRRSGQCVVSTKSEAVYSFDYKTNNTRHAGVLYPGISSICTDKNGHEWIGTKGNGIYIDGVHYSAENSEHHFISDDIYDIVCDKHGRVWIATWRKGLALCKETNAKQLRFDYFLLGDNNANRIHDLEMADDGELWIGSSGGLFHVDTNKGNVKVGDITKSAYGKGKADNWPIIAVKSARRGELWIGLTNSLLRCQLDKNNKINEVKTLDHASGIAGNTISSIEEDQYGYLWVSTDNGLSRIDQKTMIVDNIRVSDRPLENNFMPNASLHLSDGRLLFGSANGLVVVSPPKNIKHDKAKAKLAITNIEINGRSVLEGDTDGRVLYNLFTKGRLILSNDERSIDIYFSNFDYKNINEAVYQYYIEGIDHSWHMPMASNHVAYNGLVPGHYIFHVRTKEGKGWSEEKILKIHIRPPFYNTWIAWLFYLFVAIAVAYYLYHNWNVRFKLRQRVYIEKELANFRIGFFTHIAHEFRTPLSIIVGGVQRLDEQAKALKGDAPVALRIVKRGAQRLERLVNELIKFRKVSTDNMRLHVEQGDVVEFVRNICHDFWDMSQQKRQRLTFIPFTKSYGMVFDRDAVEHVVYNLVSNAVKYTPEEGTIAVKVSLDRGDEPEVTDRLVIAVEDNGPGIEPSQAEHLFEPFMHGYASQGGMGIGLYMAKSMATLHHGSLKYNDVSPHGSLFTFSLPAHDEYSVEEHQKVESDDAENGYGGTGDRIEAMIKEIAPKAMNDITVTVIEDDPDMMEQIKGELGEYFHIEGFMNGLSGYEAVRRIKPALVVCDVMLPDKNGYDVVRDIRRSPETRNIPVIMLTALDDDIHQMKGYSVGADDYMTKPCNYKMLVVRVAQLIKWSREREAQKGEEKQEISSDRTVAQPIVTSKADSRFLDQLDELIGSNMQNPDFTVDRLAEKLCMGRTTFYGRVKELTGVSPNKYLLNRRMQTAAELLKEGRYNVSEVCYKVGFVNISYFSKKFKQHFGVLPSKYINFA